ncbi:hypothetical protein TRQ7_07280 [Thermotoga sp. RQ7]|uniref:hypothetical protein n=1 Tax=Thermotoga sp. RQ7 TaxID=126738 RepID=UPI0005A35B36|nr:hypothetical protein [Thermotoga sp. RQ7]AJG41251.1 hypothetical protein TRQ7_07280 [Thermotoga sp. RQ7]
MRTLLFLMMITTVVFSVPVFQDYDYFIWFRDTGEFYSIVKQLPLFEFLLSEKGAGFEQAAIKWVENRADQPENFFQALSQEIVVCGKGNLEDLFTFDINNLLSLPYRLKEGFIAFKTDVPQKIVESFAKLNAAEFYENDDLYIIESATPLYLKTLGEYLVLSTSRSLLEKVQDEETSFENAPLVAHVKKLELFGKKGEAFLSAKASTSQFTIEITQRAESFTVSEAEDIGQLPYSGDLYAFSGAPEISRELLKEIFRGSDFEEFYRTFIDGSIMLASSLYGASELVLFVQDKSLKDVETDLISRGAERLGEEWRLSVQNGLLHFFEYRGHLVVSSMKKTEFLQAVNKRRLSNHPSFRFLEKQVPENVFLEMFIDLDSFLNKLLGFSPNSSLLLIGYVEGETIKYRLEVM